MIETNLAAISGQPKREFLSPRTPAQQKRNELLETSASVKHVIKRRWGRREIY